jgi:competence protein ComEA
MSSKRALKIAERDLLRYWQSATILLLAVMAGCNQTQNPQGIKEKAAQATAEVKNDAEAVAAGVREGWSRDKPLDLNTATRDQLVSLPGVTVAEADRVVAGRPYSEPGELVTRRIMSKTEYDKIADRVIARK